MPQDGSNNYYYPPGTPGVPDTTIESAKYNAFLDDLVGNDLNIARPVHRGGTGATTADGALTNLTAEKAGQIVSNFDSHVWQNGSFWSDVSATNGPVASQYFVGSAVMLNNLQTYVYVEATSLTDGRKFTRRKSSGVWGAWVLHDYVAAAGDTMTGPLVLGGTSQYGGKVVARISGAGPVSSIEFGHTSSAGYGSTLSAYNSAGTPYLAFNAGAGTGTNDFKTFGIKGSVLQSDLAGGFVFHQIANASADNQAPTGIATLTAAGIFSIIGGGGTPFTAAAGIYLNPNNAFVQCAVENNAGVEGAIFALSGNFYAGSFSNHPFILRSNNTDRLTFATSGSATFGYNVTINANLEVASPAGSPFLTLRKAAAASTANYIQAYRGSQTRWQMDLGGPEAESTGNAGSNFNLHRFNDDGSYAGVVLTAGRAQGGVQFTGPIIMSNSTASSSATTGALTVTGGVGIGNNMYAAGIIGSMNAGRVIAVNANASPGFASHNGTFGHGIYTGGDNRLYFNSAFATGDPSGNYAIFGAGDGNLTIIGNGYKPGGGDWAATSDLRIKNVEGDYTRGLAEVTQLRPVFYTYKGNDTPSVPAHIGTGTPEGDEEQSKIALVAPYPNSTHKSVAEAGTKFAGLVAQEVEAVIPEMVTKTDGYIDGVAVTDLRGLDTSPLIFALINAIKELKARVEQLENPA